MVGAARNSSPRDLAAVLSARPRVSLDEVRALKTKADLVIPPTMGGVTPLDLDATPQRGDQLRLDQKTSVTAPELRLSMRQFLATDLSTAAGSKEGVIKEARLHRLIRGLLGSQNAIVQRQTTAD